MLSVIRCNSFNILSTVCLSLCLSVCQSLSPPFKRNCLYYFNVHFLRPRTRIPTHWLSSPGISWHNLSPHLQFTVFANPGSLKVIHVFVVSQISLFWEEELCLVEIQGLTHATQAFYHWVILLTSMTKKETKLWKTYFIGTCSLCHAYLHDS